MKRSRILSLAMLVTGAALSFCSCKKEEGTDDPSNAVIVNPNSDEATRRAWTAELNGAAFKVDTMTIVQDMNLDKFRFTGVSATGKTIMIELDSLVVGTRTYADHDARLSYNDDVNVFEITNVGECEINITSIADNRISGTFSGELFSFEAPTESINVENGSFKNLQYTP